ncbi:MAG: phosphate/phosphite/phosphonate ABC transporter substrate-binding protein [Microcoleaceae cyanobacterium]
MLSNLIVNNLIKGVLLLGVLAVSSGCTVQSVLTLVSNPVPEPVSNPVPNPTQTPNLSANQPANQPAKASGNASGKIVIGTVASNPTWKIQQFQPLADYLASRLDGYKIGVGEVKIASDSITMAKWLKAGTVHLYFDHPYAALTVARESGAKPILRFGQGGSSEGSAVIFALKQSGLSSLDGLNGKLLAFEHPTSTTGFVLPMVYLQNANLKLVPKQSRQSAVATDEIGYLFSRDDQNSIQWVISGRVRAAAISHRSFQRLSENSRDAMITLAKTAKVPQQLVLVKSDLAAPLTKSIQQVLLQMDEIDVGQTALSAFEQPAEFFDSQITPEDITKMQEVFDKLQNP